MPSSQYAIQDANRISGQLIHSGTANSATLIRQTGQSSGASNVHLTGGTVAITGGATVYDYMGGSTSGTFTYYGFKGRNNVNWYVMRMNETNDNDVLYNYGTSGTAGFGTAWANTASLSYDQPPNS